MKILPSELSVAALTTTDTTQRMIDMPSHTAAARIMGLPISTSSHDEVLRHVGQIISQRGEGHYISITNTESMYHGLHDAQHGDYIQQADFSLCDGVGVILAGWAWGHRIERFTGPMLQLEACDKGRAHQWRHFFYGGKEGVAEELARRLTAKYPGLIVCGTHCPPFREAGAPEDDAVVDMINAAKPDLVWVGLGLPKQERWISDHRRRIHAPWMIGVGAAFDYHAGTVPWAPPALRAIGLEWLFTFLLQPRLRARRYWRSLLFVLEMAGRGALSLRFLRLLRRPASR